MNNKLIILLVTILTSSACVHTQNEEKLKPINVVIEKQSTQQTLGLTSLSEALIGAGYSPVLVDRPDATGKEEISVSMLSSDALIQKDVPKKEKRQVAKKTAGAKKPKKKTGMIAILIVLVLCVAGYFIFLTGTNFILQNQCCISKFTQFN